MIEGGIPPAVWPEPCPFKEDNPEALHEAAVGIYSFFLPKEVSGPQPESLRLYTYLLCTW